MLSSRPYGRIGGALLLLAAVLAVSASGCTLTAPESTSTAGQSQLASGAADASSAVSTTGSATGTAGGAAPKDGSKPGATKPLSSSDAKAIDAELSAIEKELDKMALPSDSDFGGIESGLE